MNKIINKILFLNPPDPSVLKLGRQSGYAYFEPPLGLLYVYDYIKKRQDVGVLFVDLNIEMKFLTGDSLEDILKRYILEYQPDMIAMATLYYQGIPVFHKMASLIKKINPKIVLVFGGHYPHHLTAKCMEDELVDYIILSEGELGLSDLIDAMNSNGQMSDIEGIVHREGNQVIRNPRKKFWDGYCDVKRLPWEDTHFKYYFREGRNLLYRLKDKHEWRPASITASRGCPNACTFCTSPSFWSRRWRKRHVENIVYEIQYLKDNYDVNIIIFNDENISVDKKWFEQLLDALATLDVSWLSSGGLSIRTLNDERIIKKMYASKIAFFNLAAESGSNEILKKIRKPLTVEETLNVVKLIRKNGSAFINAFFITGFPFEDLKSVKNTLAFAETLDTDWKGFYCFKPLPGAALFDDCIEQRLIDGFSEGAGEFYFAQEFDHIDYSSKQLGDLSYMANLKNNFINNRNLKQNTKESLAQAERDFRYVLDMVPDHVFALLALAQIMKTRNLTEDCQQLVQRAKKVLEKGSFQWRYYLETLHVDMESYSQ